MPRPLKSDKPFDDRAHKRLLEGGILTFAELDSYFDISSMCSNRKGSGFGTAALREVITKALSAGKTIKYSADYSSHLFHLYMGMIPKEREEPYLSKYKVIDVDVIFFMDSLRRCQSAEHLEDDQYQVLSTILKIEQQWSDDTKVTRQMIIDHRDFLMSLNKQHCSYITYNFIPRLLDVLEMSIHDEYPNTEQFTSIQMELSDEGREHWKEAIDEHIEFTLFKGFEQLIPFMTTDQRRRLTPILDRRRELVFRRDRSFAAESVPPQAIVLDNPLTFVGQNPRTQQSGISKKIFQDIINTYKSQSIMGYLSTFWIFSWISSTRSQTMRELRGLLLVVQGGNITNADIERALRRGDKRGHRLGLFKDAPAQKSVTGTDEVITQLREALKCASR